MQSNQHFPEWSAQAVREAVAAGKIPLLVFKRNYVKSFVSFPYANNAFKSLLIKGIPVTINLIFNNFYFISKLRNILTNLLFFN